VLASVNRFGCWREWWRLTSLVICARDSGDGVRFRASVPGAIFGLGMVG
jgi:hypothetical protein